MSNTMLRSFGLKAIADWQLTKNESPSEILPKVKLPEMQRGFVWRPHGVENLWDSLMRGYPIGTFLLAPDAKSQHTYDILDGQQRSTAIAIGFFNPWKDQDLEPWVLKNFPVLWFDVGCLIDKDSKNFNFRLSTKSHPWGYDQKNNQSALNKSEISKALKQYDIDKKYYEMPLTSFWPWDSQMPLPVSFLFEAMLSFKGEYSISWVDSLILECDRCLKSGDTRQGKDFLPRLKIALKDPRVNKKLFSLFESLLSRQIPAQETPKEFLRTSYHDEHTTNPDTSKDVDTEDTLNLFIRVNSGGVILAGEELIYSIYKAQKGELKDLQKNSFTSYIRPSRLLTFAIKMAHANYQFENQGKINPPGKVKVKDFRNFLKDENLMPKLNEFLEKQKEKKKDVFKEAHDLMSGALDFQLPYYLLAQLAQKHFEIFFILLYRLNRGDTFEHGKSEHRKMIGFITALAWFGKEEKSNGDHILKLLWRDMIELDQDQFWTANVFRNALRGSDVKMPLLVPPSELREHLLSVARKKTVDEICESDSTVLEHLMQFYRGQNGRALAVQAYKKILKSLGDHREFVMFAQRKFIKQWFDGLTAADLEDTNVPWDWDHIYATELLNRVSVENSKFLKEWNNSNGNQRAWPYDLNRGDGAKVPHEKFNLDYKNSTVGLYLVSDEVYEASAIKNERVDEWNDFAARCKTKPEFDKLLHVIINRICDIYEDWFETLQIKNLLPTKSGYSLLSPDALKKRFPVPRGYSVVLKNFEKEIELWFSKGQMDSKPMLIYYINIDKKHYTEQTDDNVVIGIEVESDVEFTKEEMESLFPEFGIEMLPEGAAIKRWTSFHGDIEALDIEFKKFMKETSERFEMIKSRINVKKAA